ncbi:MAG: hypothetical protein IPO92_14170 [Saprospiraceae bacterium]|nr:hypothetical protein [Saprospiraceae bacterium]
MTEADIDSALEDALEGEDYITNNQLETINNSLTGSNLSLEEIKNNWCAIGPNYELNSCEIALIEKYGDAVKFSLFASKSIAEKWTKLKFGYNGRNDCSDAFRHAMFNANNAFYLGADVAKEFGDAHECANTADLNFEVVMDLHNNAKGISIYNSLPKNPNGSIPSHTLADEICKQLENGELKVFSDPTDNQSSLISSNNCECN